MRALAGKLALAVSLTALVVGPSAGSTLASFTAAPTGSAGNAVSVDALRNTFLVAPGSAVQPGTSTPVASGGTDSLALTLGSVPSARTFTNVFTVKNLTAASQTAVISLQSISQVSTAVFASTGTGSVSLAAGATASVSITTSSVSAGHGAGSLRLALGGATWLYRDYAITLDEAPEAPATLSATPGPAGAIALAWTASTTSGLAGYDVYRSTSAGFTKLNATPLMAIAYTDSATTNGTAYTYKVVALTCSPNLQSLDSPTAAATADATAPAAPTLVALVNGGGTGSAYINAANAHTVSVQVTLTAGSASTDTVTVTLSNGAGSVTRTAAATTGAGTITIIGIDASALADGTVTFSATSRDLAGNVSAAKTATAPKDTVAPGAPVASYMDVNNAADQITGASGATEAGASVVATETAPTASGPYAATASALGAFTLTVAVVNGKVPTPIAVTYTVRATDAAGNTGAATTVTASDTK